MLMSNRDAAEKTMPATPARRSGVSRVFRISLTLLVTHAMAWGAGRGQGWWDARALEQRLLRAGKDAQTTRDSLMRYEARRQLDLARDALDARNFGIAQERVHRAVVLLSESHPVSELLQLSATAGKYQPEITQDIAGQRQQLAAWLGQLDSMLPELKTEH